jgi:transposase
VTLTGVTQLMPLLDTLPPIRGRRGRPRRKPRELFADRGYDYDKYRRLLLRERGIRPQIAPRGVAHGSGRGKIRWVVEHGFAWLHAFKRLRTRYERRADIHLSPTRLRPHLPPPARKVILSLLLIFRGDRVACGF